VVLSANRLIEPSDLPKSITDYAHLQKNNNQKPLSLREALEEPEKKIIEIALRRNNWNRQLTAEMLEINRTTLYKKMKHFGLEADPMTYTGK
jgi:DNA-binding NtrC family response regulator